MHAHRIECRTKDDSVTAVQLSGGMRAPKQSAEHLAVGLTVRGLRGQQGLSQEELGFRSDLHRNYVGAIERGEINPTFRVLLKLEHGLGEPLSRLIEDYEREKVIWIRPR